MTYVFTFLKITLWFLLATELDSPDRDLAKIVRKPQELSCSHGVIFMTSTQKSHIAGAMSLHSLFIINSSVTLAFRWVYDVQLTLSMRPQEGNLAVIVQIHGHCNLFDFVNSAHWQILKIRKPVDTSQVDRMIPILALHADREDTARFQIVIWAQKW